MNEAIRNNIKLLGTLVNTDESGIICDSDQVYDKKSNKSVMDRITDVENRIAKVDNNITISNETLIINKN